MPGMLEIVRVDDTWCALLIDTRQRGELSYGSKVKVATLCRSINGVTSGKRREPFRFNAVELLLSFMSVLSVLIAMELTTVS